MLTNVELMNLARNKGIQLDYVGLKDEMSAVKNKKNIYGSLNCIINLDGSDPHDFNKNGSHWTCLIIRDGSCVYFDPFGLPESIETRQFINDQRGVKHYGFNQVKIQDIKDDHCGWYCMALLMYVTHCFSNNLMDTTSNFINLFDKKDSAQNKDILLQIFFE